MVSYVVCDIHSSVTFYVYLFSISLKNVWQFVMGGGGYSEALMSKL